MVKPRLSLKGRALKYLAAREHSRIELARKLSRYATADDDLDALLSWLEANDFLSQQRFSESVVNRRAARFGNARILAELQSHSIDPESLDSIKQELLRNEAARARLVHEKKFGHKANGPIERAKQMRFLLQRGFSQHAIQAAIAGAAEIEDREEGL